MKRIWIDSLDVNLKSALRNRKFAIILVAMLFTLCSSADAQQTGKIFRIGFLEIARLPVARSLTRSGKR